jgi:hypothetical protein
MPRFIQMLWAPRVYSEREIQRRLHPHTGHVLPSPKATGAEQAPVARRGND